jgi:CheY-like chemotaxis protein
MTPETPSTEAVRYLRPKPAIRDKAELVVALACLGTLLGAIAFSEMDNNFATTMRINAVVNSALGIVSASGKAADLRRTILVVENDNVQRIVAQTTLERYGYAVVLADNGHQAQAFLRRPKPQVSLVVVDTTAIPAGEMRQLHSIRPSVPILISQAPGEKHQAGATAWIERPLQAGPLATAVSNALASR